MVSAARRLGEVPTLAERLAALERVVAELLAWKAEHEANEADGEDGDARGWLLPLSIAGPGFE
jgi:hypothetical protein